MSFFGVFADIKIGLGLDQFPDYVSMSVLTGKMKWCHVAVEVEGGKFVDVSSSVYYHFDHCYIALVGSPVKCTEVVKGKITFGKSEQEYTS